MIKVVILVCAMSVPRPDCQVWSARVYLEQQASNPLGCMFNGQATLAASDVEVRETEYVKVMCRRVFDPRTTG